MNQQKQTKITPILPPRDARGRFLSSSHRIPATKDQSVIPPVLPSGAILTGGIGRILARKDTPPKLIKQLGKLGHVLEQMPSPIPTPAPEQESKSVLLLAKISKVIASAPPEGELSKRAAERLWQRIRRLRKKLVKALKQ